MLDILSANSLDTRMIICSCFEYKYIDKERICNNVKLLGQTYLGKEKSLIKWILLLFIHVYHTKDFKLCVIKLILKILETWDNNKLIFDWASKAAEDGIMLVQLGQPKEICSNLSN